MTDTRGTVRHYDQGYERYGTASTADNAHGKILERAGSGYRILDVGCGSGHLGGDLKARDNYVVGLEISPGAAEEARGRLDEIIVGDIESMEIPHPHGFFDRIICADIIEHVFDPGALLRKLRPYLRPTGSLILSVPNVAHFSLRLELLRGRWEYREIGLLDEGHIRFFTRDTAERMIRDVGFQVVDRDLALSVPFAPPLTRSVIDFFLRRPPSWRRRFETLLAVQFIFVARVE